MFKRIHFTFIITVLAKYILFSQNLVYNGSFEKYTLCPNTGGQINRATNWFSANWGGGGSSEYYNACDNPGLCGVPHNYLGVYQYARTGNAYAGTSCYENIDEQREYIEGTLINPLIIGKEYCVSFYVSLSTYSTFGIDALGLYFTNDSLITHSSYVYNVQPQISNNLLNIISDTANWVKINGIFVALGGESFFTFGNFKRNYQTDTIRILSLTDGYAYYLIDDVAVWPCDAPIYTANAGGYKTICVGDSVKLGTHQLDEYEYRWFTKDSTIIDTTGYIIVSPDTTTTYYLRVKDFKFDVSWDTVTVYVKEICDTSKLAYIPNIFTPNNDGNNDKFYVRGENISQLDLKIYNRWGDLVFETQGINEGWDGRYKSKDCPEGVYFYIADITFVDGKTEVRKGNVTLIR